MANVKGKYPNYLRSVLSDRGVEPADLARATEIAPQNVYRFLNEERELTAPWAKRLAEGIPGAKAAELIFGPDGTYSPIKVPVYSWIQAGRFAEVPVISEDDEPEDRLIEDLPPGDWLAFKVVGDSMNSVAPEGSYVFVDRKDRELVSGKFYAFAQGADATFKRYRNSPHRLEPVSTNPTHETQFIETSEVLRIIGRVRRVVNNLV